MTATARRGRGEGSVYRDAVNGTWVGAISLGASLETLRGMSVRVLFDPDAPYERRLPSWREVVDALPVRAGTG